MESLKPARRELQLARNAVDALRSARNAGAALAAWKSALHHMERIWNKTRAALRDRAKWQGCTERGRIEALRNSDPLLAYLINARGADEHSIADIAEAVPGSIGINPAKGRNLFIRRLEMRGNKIEIESPDPIAITFTPASLRLRSVVNRGREHAVPATHLGAPLQGADPVTLAEAGLAYYADLLAKIEREFG